MDFPLGSFLDFPGIAAMQNGNHGYRIVIGGGNLPQESGPYPGETTGTARSPNANEPVPEVHVIGNEVKVIVGLPGIDEDALRMDLRGDTLIIDAGDADRHYHTSAKIPAVDRASMQKSLKNGVLEVTFMAAGDDKETTEATGS